MVYKVISLIFCICYMYNLQGQNALIDVIMGVDYSYRRLVFSEDEFVPNLIGTQRNEEEAPSINARIGLNYHRKIGHQSWMKTGLRMADLGYKLEARTGLIWPSEIETGVFILDPSLPHEVQIVNNYLFLEIPLVYRYESSSSKWKPFVEIGLAPNVYLANYQQEITDIYTRFDLIQETNAQQSTLQIAAIFSFGLIYDFSEHYQIFTQPSFRYHLNPWQKSEITEYLINGGIEIGIRKKLKSITQN